MRKITVNLYKFDELSDKAKEVARNWFRETSYPHYGWWDYIYEDAENVGLKITAFDLDRNRYAKGNFIAGAEECAHKIEKEHGDTCETFKTAKAYLAERDEIVNTAERDENGDFVDQLELDDKLDECDAEFLRSILEDYSILLQRESEYLNSDEYVDETIRANEYEFLETGEMYK